MESVKPVETVTKAKRTARPEWLACQKQWAPGQSGNPNGRPKELGVWAQIRKDLEHEGTKREVAAAFIQMLKDGDSRAWTEFLNRSEGKPVERIELSGELDLLTKFIEASRQARLAVAEPCRTITLKAKAPQIESSREIGAIDGQSEPPSAETEGG